SDAEVPMSRITVGCAASVLLLLGPAIAGEPDEAEIRRKLAEPVNPTWSPTPAKLSEILDILAKESGLRMELDQAAFQNKAIDKPIDNAPLRDILEFLCDKYELKIFVDSSAFERVGQKHVLDAACSSPKSDERLIECIAFFAREVKGQVVVRDGIILILPQTK